eukprot:g44074.t1
MQVGGSGGWSVGRVGQISGTEVDSLRQAKEAGMRGRIGHGKRPGLGDFETGEFYIQTPKVEYEVLFLQLAFGIIVTLEETQDGHVTQGVGGEVKMAGDRKMLLIIAYRVQMLHESVTESMLGLTDVEETILGELDTVDQVGGGTGESLSVLEIFSWALDGGEGVGAAVSAETAIRYGDREFQEGEGGIRDGLGEFEVGVKGLSKVDELFKLLMGARGSVGTVIDVAEEEKTNGKTLTEFHPDNIELELSCPNMDKRADIQSTIHDSSDTRQSVFIDVDNIQPWADN